MFDSPPPSGLLLSDADNRIADHFWQEMTNWSELSLQKPLTFLCNVYLVSSYLYYHLSDSILDDHSFDALCRQLFKRYGEIQAHPNLWHRHLISQAALSAGTGFSLKPADYPPLIADVAKELYRRKGPDEVYDPPMVFKRVLHTPVPVVEKRTAKVLDGQMSLFLPTAV